MSSDELHSRSLAPTLSRMSERRRRGWTDNPLVRQLLVGIGFVLIALTPVVGPIPGPGGIIVFGAGLSLVLKYTGWAKRLYVRFKRAHPNKGRWTDWSLRRLSARRRHERAQREIEQPAELTSTPPSPIGAGEQAATGGRFHSDDSTRV
ncbi:hypothetical protein [Sphingosinicella sp.]|uniref:hypothetical protein n=1 Tax=Sphingosinicella sp. TaxID=1917971 RepID=UPI004037DD64